MLSHYLNCSKNTESKKPGIEKTKNGKIMLLSNCTVCASKIGRFIKEQEASGILSSLDIEIPSKVTK